MLHRWRNNNMATRHMAQHDQLLRPHHAFCSRRCQRRIKVAMDRFILVFLIIKDLAITMSEYPSKFYGFIDHGFAVCSSSTAPSPWAWRSRWRQAKHTRALPQVHLRHTLRGTLSCDRMTVRYHVHLVLADAAFPRLVSKCVDLRWGVLGTKSRRPRRHGADEHVASLVV